MEIIASEIEQELLPIHIILLFSQLVRMSTGLSEDTDVCGQPSSDASGAHRSPSY